MRLLIYCMRGAKGTLGSLSLPNKATGFRPVKNHHGVARAEHLQAPSRPVDRGGGEACRGARAEHLQAP